MLYKGRPQSISAHQPASSHETRSRRVVLSIQARFCWAFGMAMAAPGSQQGLDRRRQRVVSSRPRVDSKQQRAASAAYMGPSGQYVVLVGSYGQRQAGRAFIGSRVFVSAVVEVSEIPRSHPSRMEQMAPHGLCEVSCFFLRCLGDVERSVSWESTTTTSNCRRLRRVEEEKDRNAAAISASASRPSGLALGCQEPSGRRSIALPAVDGRCAGAAKSFLPRRRGPGRGPVGNRVSLESRCRD